EMEGLYWRYETFLKRAEGSRGSLLGANGGIYAIRKKLFEGVPGNTVIEDFVIPMRILEKGHSVLYEPEAIAYEETAKNIVKEMARRVRIGAGDFQSLFLTRRLLNPLRGFSAFAFFSHKVIRWFAPFFLMAALFSNAFLVGDDLYTGLFIMQCGFYFLALLGRIFSFFNIHTKILGFFYYFVSMNIALLLGFFKFLTGTQSVMWERTDR
ncbi:MAG: glycosyltransferase, partial [bacterium]